MLPPGTLSPVTIYRQPGPPRRSRWATFRMVLLYIFVALLMSSSALAGGLYLWVHEDVVGAVAVKSVDVKKAAKRLDVPVADQPTNALIVGYDQRKGADTGNPPRSDTVMLVRADPTTDSISLLSFPRDLVVDVTCPGKPTYRGRINEAYTECGTRGTLETVRKLTKLPVNYLITVNFKSFRQLVDAVGGVWVDIDRRYFNDQGGPTGFATINLHPGYQRLGGYQALDYVRFRHTDSDLYRVARQQAFVRALKDQVRSAVQPDQAAQARAHRHEQRRGRRRRRRRARRLDPALVRALRLRPPTRPFLPVEDRRAGGLCGADDGDARTSSGRFRSSRIRTWSRPRRRRWSRSGRRGRRRPRRRRRRRETRRSPS